MHFEVPHNRQNLLFESKQINQHSSEEFNRTQSFHNKTITMSRIQPQLAYLVKNQQNITKSQKIRLSVETGPEVIQMLELVDKNFKVDIITGSKT